MLDRQTDINPSRRWGDPWTLLVQPSERGRLIDNKAMTDALGHAGIIRAV